MPAIKADWLDRAETHRLAEALAAACIDFRFVGGAVRDALLARVAIDVDIATPAAPDAVIEALTAAKLKSVPTGIVHGTVTALIGKRHFEITTLRRDVETDGRHAKVEFTDDWREDAQRRDFTMNALYADREGRITDFFDGIGDAQAGRVRFIGDPATRIGEDALRILRFFRFHAHYGKGPLDVPGLAACRKFVTMIDRLSGERVRDELLKLLAAPDPTFVWRVMEAGGIAEHVIGETGSADMLACMVALEATLGLPADPLRRLAAVTQSAGLKARLKLSNRDADYLQAVIGSADRVAMVSERAFGQALYGAQPPTVRDATMLAHARTGALDMANLVDFLGFVETWTEPAFPLTGADVSARGVAPGVAFGRALSAVEDWWKDENFTPDRAACLAKLDEALGITRPPPLPSC